jgi:RNA polymerase sigma-70 factor (ECF subfamily)
VSQGSCVRRSGGRRVTPTATADVSRRPTPAADQHSAAHHLTELVERVAVGYEPAFNSLYTATCDRVYGTVQHIVQNASLSSEVTQDVFVELWRYASRYDSSMGSVMTWTLTIARRRAIDRVRHEERRRQRDTRYADDHPRAEVDVFAQVDRSLDAKHVRIALLRLTTRQREAVELAYLRGYTNHEIASLLDIPLGTAKTRIRDGLLQLRTALDDQAWLVAPRGTWSSTACTAGKHTSATR